MKGRPAEKGRSKTHEKRGGRQYAQTGEIDAALLAEIGSPMIPEDTYAKIVNGNA